MLTWQSLIRWCKTHVLHPILIEFNLYSYYYYYYYYLRWNLDLWHHLSLGVLTETHKRLYFIYRSVKRCCITEVSSCNSLSPYDLVYLLCIFYFVMKGKNNFSIIEELRLIWLLVLQDKEISHWWLMRCWWPKFTSLLLLEPGFLEPGFLTIVTNNSVQMLEVEPGFHI